MNPDTLRTLAMALLVAGTALTVVAPASAAPVVVDATVGVTVDVTLLGTSIIDSTSLVWFNADDFATPKPLVITVDNPAASSGEDIQLVRFGMEDFEGTGTPEPWVFSGITGPTPGAGDAVAGWPAGAAADSDSTPDGSSDTVEWAMTPPATPLLCDGIPIPADPADCDNNGIADGEVATFTVSIAADVATDIPEQQFNIVLNDDAGSGPYNEDSGPSGAHSIFFGVDATDPAITGISFSDGAGGAAGDFHGEADGAFTVSFTATDPMSGLAALPTASQGTVSCPGFTAGITTALACTITGLTLTNGANTVTMTVADVAGNVADSSADPGNQPYSVTIKVDRLAPVTASADGMAGEPNGAGWYNARPTITLSASDRPTGVAGTDNAGVASTEWCQGAACVPATTGAIPQLAEGVTTLRYRSTDLAHPANSETVHDETYSVDITLPSLSLYFSDGTAVIGSSDPVEWHSEDPAAYLLLLNATDALSLLDAFEVVHVSSDAVPVRTTLCDFTALGGVASRSCDIDTSAFADGTHSFEITATDVAGNTITNTADYYLDIDTEAPTVDVDVNGANATASWYNSVSSVVFTAAEPNCANGASGINSLSTYEWTLGGTPQGPVLLSDADPSGDACGYSADITPALAQGSNTLDFDIQDLAHQPNDGDTSFELLFDNTAPAITNVTLVAGAGSDFSQHHSEANAAISVTFDASDATSGLQLPTTTAGSLDCGAFTEGDLTASCTVTFDADDLAEGANDLTLGVLDVAGNAATGVDRTILVDRSAPETSLDDGVASEPNGAGWHKTAPSVTLNATDKPDAPTASAGVDATLYCMGAACVPATAYTGAVAIGEGTTVFRYASSDLAHDPNTESTQETTFQVDLTPPTAALSFDDDPPGGSNDTAPYHSEAAATVTLTLADTGGSGIDTGSILFKRGATTLPCAALTCTDNVGALADGTYAYTADASDTAGNPAIQATLTVKVDRTAPLNGAVTVTGGTAGSNGWYTSAPTILEISPTDAASGVRDASWSWTVHAGGGTQVEDDDDGLADGFWDVTPTFAQGQGELTYAARDLAHAPNVAADSFFDVWVDLDAPAGGVAFDDGSGDAPNDANASLYHSEGGPSPGVTFTFQDAVSGLASVTFNVVDGAPADAAYNVTDGLGDTGLKTFTIALDDLPEGETTYTATATDAAGLQTVTAITVHVDTAGPTVVAPVAADITGGTLGNDYGPDPDFGWYTAAPTAVSAAVTDGTGDVAGVSSFTYAWSGAATGGGTVPAASGDVTPTSFGEGANALTISADDLAHTPNSLVNATALTIHLDSVAPDATLGTLTTPRLPGAITFPCGVTEATSGVAEVRLYVDLPGGPVEFDQVALLDCDDDDVEYTPSAGSGSYGFAAAATDAAGNVEAAPTSAEQTVVVDGDAPTSSVGVDAPQGTSDGDGLFGLAITAADTHTSVASVDLYVRKDNGTWTLDATYAGGATHTFDATSTGDGVYDFRTVATDAVGNVETDVPAGGDVTITLVLATPALDIDLLPALDTYETNVDPLTVTGTTDGDSVSATLDGSATGVTVDDDGAVDGAWMITFDFDGDGTHVLNFTAEGGANPDAHESRSVLLDTVDPTFVSASTASGGSFRDLGSVTLTFDDDASGVDEATTGNNVAVTRGVTTLTAGVDYTVSTGADGTGQVTVDLEASNTDGLYTIAVTAYDEAGNDLTGTEWTATLDSGLNLIDVSGSPPFTVASASRVVGGTKLSGVSMSTVSAVSGCGNGATPTTSAFTTTGTTWSFTVGNLLLDNSPSLGDCTYTVTVRGTDGFGGTESEVFDITRTNIIPTIEVRVTATDTFAPVGESVLLTFEARDVTGNVSWDDAPVAPNVRIKPQRDAVEIGSTLLTNSLGRASFSVKESPLGSATDANGQNLLGNPTQIFISGQGFQTLDSAHKVVTDADVDIVWTRLVLGEPASFDGESVAGRGEALVPRLLLLWDHDDAPATLIGDNSGLMWQVTGTGNGSADPLVPDTPSDLVVAGFQDLGSGYYGPTYVHQDGDGMPLVEQVTFTSMGEVVGYTNDVDDPADTFAAPTTAAVTGNWIGARAGPVTLDNQDDPTDTTDDFVNEDATVRVAVPVTYTRNFDPDGDGHDADPADNTTVGLFLTGLGVGADPTVDENADHFATCADGALCDLDAAADGTVTFDVELVQLSLTSTPNTFTLAAFPEELTPGDGFTQDINQTGPSPLEDDRGDFADPFDLTFTGVEVAYAAGSLGNEADDDGSRWWFNADPDASEDDTDHVTFQVDATFTHDGSDAAGATLGAFHDDDGNDTTPRVPLGGGTPLTAVTNATGRATFTFDPDDHGLDYAVQDLAFQVVSAPEPDTPAEAIDFDSGAFEQEMLWTKIHVDVVSLEGEDEFDLGDDVSLDVRAYYYHDEDGDGGFFAEGFSGGTPDEGDIDAGDEAAGIALTLELHDTVPDGDVLLTQDESASATGGFSALIALWRGCDDGLADANNTACDDNEAGDFGDEEQAGWHRFLGDASGTPHGIRTEHDTDGDTAVQLDAEDMLWTAAALDTTTDRVLQEAGSDITADVTAHYAHSHGFGGLLNDTERRFPYDLFFDLDRIAPTAATLADEALLAALTAESVALANPSPGAPAFQAVPGSGGVSLLASDPGDAPDTSTHPVTTIVAGPEFVRLWADLALAPGWSEGNGDPDCLDGGETDFSGDGDCDDALYVKDALALRNDDVEVRATVTVDVGTAETDDAGDDAYDLDGSGAVTDTHAGLSFNTTDDALLASMPTRAHATVGQGIALQNLLNFTGDEDAGAFPPAANPTTVLDRAGGPASEFTYTGGVWTATIPDHAELQEDIDFCGLATFQLTTKETVATDGGAPADNPVATTVDTDGCADLFEVTYTAAILDFVAAVSSDAFGELPATALDDLWVNLGETADYTATARWAHDGDGDGESYLRDGTHDLDGAEDCVVGAVWSTSNTEGLNVTQSDGDDPCEYDFALASASVSDPLYTFRVASADDPSTGDDAQDFAALDPDMLNLADLTLQAYFTRLDFAFASDEVSYHNVGDNAEVDFSVSWAHDGSPVSEAADGVTVWEFPSGEFGFTEGPLGIGSVLLVDDETSTLDFGAPGNEPALSGIGPHGIHATALLGTVFPSLTWTQIEVTGAGDGTTTPAASRLAGPYDPPGPATTDVDVYLTGTIVTQPASFRFDHNDADLPDGSLVRIAGQSKTTTGGDASARIRSFTEAWFLVESRGVSAELGTTEITATTVAQNQVGFDAGGDGI